MKKNLIQLMACVLLAALAGCGKSESKQTQSPDPATQPEAQAALFQRTCDRARSLIANKDYALARSTLDVFKDYKLTDEQKKIVNQLTVQIPKSQ